MASGDPVVQVLKVIPPASNAARIDTRAGGSTPNEAAQVWDFDAAATVFMDFLCQLVGYDGSGLTFTLPWSSAAATSGDARWELGIRRLTDDAEDYDTSHSYDTNGVTDTAPSACGELSYPQITFSDGADMDSWDDGELAIVRVCRDHDHGDDDMSGDAELWGLIGAET